MDTPKTSNTKSPKPNDNLTSEPSKPVEVSPTSPRPSDTKTAAVTPETATPKDTKSGKKEDARRVISVAFPARTVKQLKLLANVEGVSIASIVIASVSKTVAKRLPGAIEALKSDVEG